MSIDTWQIRGGGFHFGRQGLGQEVTGITFPSDSLFAAVVDRLAYLKEPDAVGSFMEPMRSGSPPFVLSSTFPFSGGVRFFPAPLFSGPPGHERQNTVPFKELKRVQFISEKLFGQLFAGATLSEIGGDAVRLQDQQVWFHPDESNGLPPDVKDGHLPIWAVERRPRVTIGRHSALSTIFFTGRVVFQRDSGLWFAVRWLQPDAKIKTLLTEILAELGTVGLGAERSAGFGACRITPSGSLELAGDVGKPWLTLSRYLPLPDEMESLRSPIVAYRIETVGGWLDSPARRGQRRRPVNLLAEGSVFGNLPRAVPGQIVNVQPRYPSDPDPVGHPVYRSGLAFAVTIEGGAE